MTVVIPVYNGCRFVGSAINSVLQQTYRDYEIIVVDDGSTDETSTVVESYAPRVQLVRQRNAGSAAARNSGLERASSPLVAFLDADDLWLPDKLRIQVEALERRPDVGVVHSSWITRLSDGALVPFVKEAGSPEAEVRSVVLGGNICPSSVLAHRRHLEDVGLFRTDMKLLEDADLWLRLVSRGVGFMTLGEPLVVYRVHQASKTASSSHAELLPRLVASFFEQEGLPDLVSSMREEALGRAYLAIAEEAMRRGDRDQFPAHLGQALRFVGAQDWVLQRLAAMCLPAGFAGTFGTSKDLGQLEVDLVLVASALCSGLGCDRPAASNALRRHVTRQCYDGRWLSGSALMALRGISRDAANRYHYVLLLAKSLARAICGRFGRLPVPAMGPDLQEIDEFVRKCEYHVGEGICQGE